MKALYTIDLNEYELISQISYLHCGPSLCIRHMKDDFYINLVLLQNITFTVTSYNIFLEEIKKISHLPEHPCILKFIGLSYPHPNFYNSIGIAFEYSPSYFPLSLVIDEFSKVSNQLKRKTPKSLHHPRILSPKQGNRNRINENNYSQTSDNQSNELHEENVSDLNLVSSKNTDEINITDIIDNQNTNSNSKNGDNEFNEQRLELQSNNQNNLFVDFHKSINLITDNSMSLKNELDNRNLLTDSSTNLQQNQIDLNSQNLLTDSSMNLKNDEIQFDNFDNKNSLTIDDTKDEKPKEVFEDTSRFFQHVQPKPPENTSSSITNEQILIITYGVSNAMTFLHQHDVLFMNMNLNNIILNEHLQPKIQYYGISVLADYFPFCCCCLPNSSFLLDLYYDRFDNVLNSLSPFSFTRVDGIRMVKKGKITNRNHSDHFFLVNDISYGVDPSQSANFLKPNLENYLYVAPEIMKGRSLPNKSSDVYACSFMIYRLWAKGFLSWISNLGIVHLVKLNSGKRFNIPISIFAVIRDLINRGWDSVPDKRPFMSEINSIIKKFGPYSFYNESDLYMSTFRKFQDSLPHYKKVNNNYEIQMIYDSYYDSVDKLDISISGKTYAKKIILLQNLLMNLRLSNISETAARLFPNFETKKISKKKQQSHELDPDHFAMNKVFAYSLALNLVVAAKCRFKKIYCYAQFISFILHQYSNQFPCLLKLKKYILSLFVSSLANYCAYPNALPTVALVCYCVQLDVISVKEIIRIISQFYEDHKTDKKISISILFCWFCPEISKESPELFNKMRELIQTQVNYAFFPNAFKGFMKNFDQYKENDWKLYLNKRNDKELNSCSYFLRRDNDDALRKLAIKNPGLFSHRLDQDIFVPCPLVHDFPSSVLYAAIYGSSKCFMLMLRWGSKSFYSDRKYRTLPHFVVAGGNEYLYSITMQSFRDYDSLLQVASEYHQNLLFYTIYQSNPNMLEAYDQIGKSVKSAAAISNNVATLAFAMVNDQRPFAESFGRTPFHNAAEYGMINALRLLLFMQIDQVNKMIDQSEQKKKKFLKKPKKTINLPEIINKCLINVNVQDSWGMTPLHLAADQLKSKSIKVLFWTSYLNPNISNVSGKTPVFYAIKTKDLKIVKLFVQNQNVDFTVTNKKGETPLHVAVKIQCPEIISLIIENRPETIDVCNKDNMRPFEMATAANDQPIIAIFNEYFITQKMKLDKSKKKQSNKKMRKKIWRASKSHGELKTQIHDIKQDSKAIGNESNEDSQKSGEKKPNVNEIDNEISQESDGANTISTETNQADNLAGQNKDSNETINDTLSNDANCDSNPVGKNEDNENDDQDNESEQDNEPIDFNDAGDKD